MSKLKHLPYNYNISSLSLLDFFSSYEIIYVFILFYRIIMLYNKSLTFSFCGYVNRLYLKQLDTLRWSTNCQNFQMKMNQDEYDDRTSIVIIPICKIEYYTILYYTV